MTNSAQPEDIDEIRATFAALDFDGDGSISVQELGLAIRALGHDPTQEQMTELIAEWDKNNDDRLDLEEFQALYTSFKNEYPSSPDMEAAFRTFDADGDGVLSVDEFRRILQFMGEKLNDEEVNEVLQDADVDGDGFINYAEDDRIEFGEFLSLYTSFKKSYPTTLNPGKDIAEAFRLLDSDRDGVISQDRVRRILLQCGEALNEEEVDELLQGTDVDKHGNINYSDFVISLMKA